MEMENPEILKPVEKTNELKEWLVDYVGKKQKPDNGEVNVEMVIKTLADEFPEFLLPVAEENFIRGYQQAMLDLEQSEKYIREALTPKEEVDE
jgi:hypothetical protein